MASTRILAMLTGALLGFAVSEAPAQVVLTQSTFGAGVNFAAFFKVERGCGAAPTTALRVEIPDGVSVLQLPEKPGWTVSAERAGPRVVAVTWQGNLASVQADQFGLLVKLPAKPGPLYFPAFQRCAGQEIPWTGTSAAGGVNPAPMLTLVGAAPDAHAHHGAPIAIQTPWARATPPTAQTAAAYLTIVNNGADPDVLVAASSPVADRVEFHETTMTDGIMRMRPATRGIMVPAGQSIELKPDGGHHLMLGGLKEPLRSGTMIPITLRFAKAGTIEAVFAVEPIGARAPSAGGAADHKHH